MGRIEGEVFAVAGLAVAGFLNTSDFVVDVMEDVTSLVRDFDLVAKSTQHRIFQGDQSWLVVPCYLIYNHEEEHHYQPTTFRYGQSISMMHSLRPSG